MTGLLCAIGIVGSTLFSIGWSSDKADPAAAYLALIGATLLVVAGIGGLIWALA